MNIERKQLWENRKSILEFGFFCKMGSSLRFLIRDLFLGCNSQVQDFERALLLASTDEDSKWLCKIFSAVPKCAEDAKEILLRYSDDVRALSFAAFVVNSSFPDFDLLSKCAEKEDPFALAVMATKVNVSQGRIMAKKAAKAGERDAFFVLGQSWLAFLLNVRLFSQMSF